MMGVQRRRVRQHARGAGQTVNGNYGFGDLARAAGDYIVAVDMPQGPGRRQADVPGDPRGGRQRLRR